MYFKNRKVLRQSQINVECSKLVNLLVSLKESQQQIMASHSTQLSFINSKSSRKLKTIIIWKHFFLKHSSRFWIKTKFFDLGSKSGLPEWCQIFLSCFPRWEPKEQPPPVHVYQCTEIVEALLNAWVEVREVISKGNLQEGFCYWPPNKGNNTN